MPENEYLQQLHEVLGQRFDQVNAPFIGEQANVPQTDEEFFERLTDHQYFLRLTTELRAVFESEISSDRIALPVDLSTFGQPPAEEEVDRVAPQLDRLESLLRKQLPRELLDELILDLASFLARLEKAFDITFNPENENGVVIRFSSQLDPSDLALYNPETNEILINTQYLLSLNLSSSPQEIQAIFIALKGSLTHEATHAYRNLHFPDQAKASFPLYKYALSYRPSPQQFSSEAEFQAAFKKWHAEYYVVLPHETEAAQVTNGIELFWTKMNKVCSEVYQVFSPATVNTLVTLPEIESFIGNCERLSSDLDALGTARIGYQDVPFTPLPDDIATIVIDERDKTAVSFLQLKAMVEESADLIRERLQQIDDQALAHKMLDRLNVSLEFITIFHSI